MNVRRVIQVPRPDIDMLFLFALISVRVAGVLKIKMRKICDNLLKMQHFCQMLVWQGSRNARHAFFHTRRLGNPVYPLNSSLELGLSAGVWVHVDFFRLGGKRT